MSTFTADMSSQLKYFVVQKSLLVFRYKLVRYNAPKDIRAGPTRQHLTDHHGAAWLTADASERCTYDLDVSSDQIVVFRKRISPVFSIR